MADENAAGDGIRAATADDIDALIELQSMLFRAAGYDEPDVANAVESMRAYFEAHLPSGAFRVWVAQRDGQLVASIGLVVHSIPPTPANHVGKEAYVMNLVTRPECRRQGLATALLRHVLSTVEGEGIPVVTLHATAAGRRLYESLGFVPVDDRPEMRRAFSS